MTTLPVSRRSPLTHRLAPYLLLAPAILLVLVVLGYPMLRQLIMSFQEFGLAQQFGQAPEWVGLDNYVSILTDPYFWTVLLKSLAFCAWTAGLTMVFAVGFSLLMRSASNWARTIMNISLVIVWAMPLLAALTVWQWLVDPRFGLLNHLLTSLGFSQFEGFSWLASSFWTFYLIASAVIIWASTPLACISIYSALTQVDDSQLEAAQLDGAGYAGRVRHIIVPTIMPVLSLIGVLQVIWDLRVFAHINVLQGAGGVSTETNLLGNYVFQQGLSQGNYGVASAIAMVILLVTLIVTAKYIQMLFKGGENV